MIRGASQVAPVLKNPPANAGDTEDVGLIPGSIRSPRGVKGNSFQYSCLENPIDREAYRFTVHRFAELDMTEQLRKPSHVIKEAVLTNCTTQLLSWSVELKSKVYNCKIVLFSTKSLTFPLMSLVLNPITVEKNHFPSALSQIKLPTSVWALLRTLWAPFRNPRVCQHHFFAKKHFNWKKILIFYAK